MAVNPNPYLNKIPHMVPKIRAIGTMIDPAQNPEDAFNSRMQPITSIAANRPIQSMDVSNDLRFEKPTFSPPTQVSKGLTTSNAGGSFTLYDVTGGTKIFDYNPATGVVTINGSLQANNVNTGTYTNVTLAGNNPVVGTMQNGVYGTSQITGGTINAGVYQTGGTVGAAGSIVYVKSVNFAGSTTTLGTVNFNNGLITSFS